MRRTYARPWTDYIRDYVNEGAEQAYLVGKGWSASEFLVSDPDMRIPLIACNEMISYVPYGVGIAWDMDPVFNVAKMSRCALGDMTPPCVRVGPPMIVQDKWLLEDRLKREMRLGQMFEVGVFEGGEQPTLKSTAAWALHMLAYMRVKTVVMAGFDLFFHPEKRRDCRSPYNEAALTSIRHGAPQEAAQNLGVRSQDYGAVNRAMQSVIDAYGLRVIEWRPDA